MNQWAGWHFSSRCCAFAGSVLTQHFAIYTAKEQSQQQIEKEKYVCYTWAKRQTGFDPLQDE